MHQPIPDHLEEYLRDPGSQRIPPEFHGHKSVCANCAGELRTLELQNRLLRTLRAPEGLEPSVGFYARVLSRIEEQTPDSFWSLFLEPAFGRSLSIACAALVLVMGTYLIRTEPGEQLASPSGVVMSQAPSSGFEDGTVQPRERDAVLVNLASFRE